MLPLNLYARVRVLLRTLHTRPRVQRAPGLPCALCYRGGQDFEQTSGAIGAARSRMCGCRRMGGAKRYPSPRAPALMGIASLHPSLLDCRRQRRLRTAAARRITHETGPNPQQSECRILQCSTACEVAPANGQWQSVRLLCIGAVGIQASERALRKKMRGRKHA